MNKASCVVCCSGSPFCPQCVGVGTARFQKNCHPPQAQDVGKGREAKQLHPILWGIQVGAPKGSFVADTAVCCGAT